MLPVTVILNPYSGRGKGRKIRPALEAALHKAGLQFDLYETNGPGHAIDLTWAAKQRGAQVVISVGGDGTVNEVVNGLLQSAEPDSIAGMLAVLPIGTGNDFATTIGQRSITSLGASTIQQLERLTQAILQRRQRLVDIGWGRVCEGSKTSERYFDNNMAAGLEAQSGIYSNSISGLPARAIYTLAAMRAIATYRAPHVKVQWHLSDDTRQELSQRSCVISIGNNHRTGGGYLITPDAKLDDGLFDVAILRTQPLLPMLRLMILAMSGKHTTHSAVTMLRTTELHIQTDEGMPVHLDGEIVAERATQIDVRILPAKLALIC